MGCCGSKTPPSSKGNRGNHSAKCSSVYTTHNTETTEATETTDTTVHTSASSNFSGTEDGLTTLSDSFLVIPALARGEGLDVTVENKLTGVTSDLEIGMDDTYRILRGRIGTMEDFAQFADGKMTLEINGAEVGAKGSEDDFVRNSGLQVGDVIVVTQAASVRAERPRGLRRRGTFGSFGPGMSGSWGAPGTDYGSPTDSTGTDTSTSEWTETLRDEDDDGDESEDESDDDDDDDETLVNSDADSESGDDDESSW
eukprot:Rhum_TRINITY_DN9022_c0_g1::Rhum_TRINITY_DN9022_c0_g1_i1::g.31191::m.31191